MEIKTFKIIIVLLALIECETWSNRKASSEGVSENGAEETICIYDEEESFTLEKTAKLGVSESVLFNKYFIMT
jgi:hypothetical protein